MGDWVEPAPHDEELAAFPRLVDAAAALEEADPDEDGHWNTLVDALVAGLRPPA